MKIKPSLYPGTTKYSSASRIVLNGHLSGCQRPPLPTYMSLSLSTWGPRSCQRQPSIAGLYLISSIRLDFGFFFPALSVTLKKNVFITCQVLFMVKKSIVFLQPRIKRFECSHLL